MLWANIWLGVYKWGLSGPTLTGQAVVISLVAAACVRNDAQASSAKSVRRSLDKMVIPNDVEVRLNEYDDSKESSYF